MSKLDDLTRLKHMRDAAAKAIAFVDGKTRDELKQDEMLALALVRLIEIIGEAANHVSVECQICNSQIPWREMVGMRNRIVHAYFDVDLEVVWQVVTADLPDLLESTKKAIPALEAVEGRDD